MKTPPWFERAARGFRRWVQEHPDAAGPGGPGDSQTKTLIVAGVLWFCATLAISAIIAGASLLASGEEVSDVAAVNWDLFLAVMVAWMATLNVPVWGLAWWRSKGTSGARGGRGPTA